MIGPACTAHRTTREKVLLNADVHNSTSFFIFESHAIQTWSAATHPLHDKAEGRELAGAIADQLTFQDVGERLA